MNGVPARLTAALADRYTIERELGQGGMATVYLAHDVKHDREVAVKVLREDLTAAMGAARFLREIRIAARLQHPNILPLLDSGEADGLLFYVMPFVNGQSLRERIDREGELPVQDAVRLLGEVVDALVEAHAHGVVHRDIKPDNVMISGRHALVTDFGVAKAVSDAADPDTITTIGVTVGTPAYMSPEQATADPHVDHRSDIYAVGVLAYEMLTGQPPFTGKTAQQVLAAHITRAPDSIIDRRSAVPGPLDQVIMQCLAKHPADRWQTMTELHAALEPFATASAGVTPTRTLPVAGRGMRASSRWIAVIVAIIVVIGAFAWWRIGRQGSGDPAIRAIAVLPFDNVSHDSADDYLADGMANDVRAALMKVPALSVKARTSSESERDKPIHQAGALLHVGALLQGEFHTAANHITVTVDLVKVSDETALWSRDFELPPDGNFSAIQDSITVAVAKALHLAMTQAETGSVQQRGTTDQDAYDLYLRGDFLFSKRGADNLHKAIDYFHQAIHRDSSFARAYAGLATAEGILSAYDQTTNQSMIHEAEMTARRALALDPNLAEAHVALADALMAEYQLAAAEAEFQTAITLDPRNETAHQWHGANLTLLGRPDDGAREGEAAVELDPLSAAAYIDLAYTYVCDGRYLDAITAGRRATALDPSLPFGRMRADLGLAMAGHPDSAAAEFGTLMSSDSTFPLVRAFDVWRFALLGRWADAEREAALIPRTEPAASRDVAIAMAQAALGNNAAAVDALGRAVRTHAYFVSEESLGCDPMFSVLHGDPRFAAMVRNAGQGLCTGAVKWPIPPRPGNALQPGADAANRRGRAPQTALATSNPA